MKPVNPATPTPQVLAKMIEEFLRRLCSGGEATSMSEFVENELSFSQVRVMMVLAYVDTSLPINQIAGQLEMTLASVGRNVESLLREGFVERTEDPGDRRVKLVRLTAAGQDLISRHFECHRKVLADFTGQLDGENRSRLAAALGPILGSDLLGQTRQLDDLRKHPR